MMHNEQVNSQFEELPLNVEDDKLPYTDSQH